MSTTESQLAALEALIVSIQQIRTDNSVTRKLHANTLMTVFLHLSPALVSAIAFLIYDIALKFDKEVEYVWKARWSIPKVLFIFGRYYGLLFNIGGEILFTTVVNVIIIMRLNAMYQNFKVLVSLIVLLVCEFALELYITLIMAISTAENVITIPLDLPFPGCLSNPGDNRERTLICWIPTLIIATVFCLMTIAKLFEGGRWKLHRLRESRNFSPLIVSFIRDGALIFSLIFVILLASTIVTIVTNSELTNLPMPWLIAVYSFCASRLVLNPREVASRRHVVTALPNDTIELMTPMKFADRSRTHTESLKMGTASLYGRK
ncbi:hypothetical protein BJ138DRAFT_1117543 [Hygrophoropsis aurantiaca]|uniref:Uncharacterized protein n=1 Tax=Hygrophoropsis aurantiaca TaxID=72124 RepID=A0ACB7ZZY4_9AGAM|nr:hypothetical protein BJ138DRAFT_1117543 [Hygrophoropsis aurantiaca]